jgi:hypothetical protein
VCLSLFGESGVSISKTLIVANKKEKDNLQYSCLFDKISTFYSGTKKINCKALDLILIPHNMSDFSFLSTGDCEDEVHFSSLVLCIKFRTS